MGIDGTETELDFSQLFEGTDGKLYKVVAIGESAFENNTTLQNVDFTGVKSIGFKAFYKATGLANVVLANSLTNIESQAFYDASTPGFAGTIDLYCNINDVDFMGIFRYTDFTTLVIHEGVSYIGDYAFAGCGIKDIEFPSNDISLGEDCFRNCGITELDFPKNIKGMGIYVFADCRNLTRVDLSNMSISPVKGQFSGSKSLKEINFGNISFLPDGFLYQSGIEELVIPSSIKSIGVGALRECSNLTSLTFEYGVTEIDKCAIYSNNKLINLILPNSLKTIGSQAIAFNDSLLEINIPSGVTNIASDAFYYVPHIYYTGSAKGAPWGALAIN